MNRRRGSRWSRDLHNAYWCKHGPAGSRRPLGSPRTSRWRTDRRRGRLGKCKRLCGRCLCIRRCLRREGGLVRRRGYILLLGKRDSPCIRCQIGIQPEEFKRHSFIIGKLSVGRNLINALSHKRASIVFYKYFLRTLNYYSYCIVYTFLYLKIRKIMLKY